MFQSVASECAMNTEIVVGDPGLLVPLLDDHFPNLKWMQSTWAGVNAILDKTTRRDYALTRLGGVFGQLMADYVIGQILMHERRFPELLTQQKNGVWDQQPFLRPRKMTDLTLSILGMGDIGQVVAKRAQGMGLQTFAYKRDGSNPPYADKTSTQLEEVLSNADFIVNILPSTPSTRGLLSGGVLRHCKGAVFINVGRGDVIDEAALLEALHNRWISKAVGDVFTQEPLPPSSPLWKHDDVVITPHISAPSLVEDVAAVFVQNLERHAVGNSLLHVANWEKGY